MTDLTGKTVLLTGASRGIGAATAHALGAAGARVIAHYGSFREGAEQAVAELPEERKLLLQTDLSVAGSARSLWRQALDWQGRVDAVIANAAVIPETPFAASDEDWDRAWDEILRVNLLEPVSLLREAVGHFVTAGGGTIVTMSSWVAQRGSAFPDLGGYAATKGGLKAFTQTIARNYGRENILAYIVAPGIVRTRMSAGSAALRGGIDALNAELAMGEVVPPEDVAGLIAYLASGECRHLSGATLDVNGATYIR